MDSMNRATGREASRVLVAVYFDETTAREIATRLIGSGCRMDQIAVLGRRRALGDDPLHLCGKSIAARNKAWKKSGPSWGAFGGMLTGTGAFFLLPGITPIEAIGILAVTTASGTVLGLVITAIVAAVSRFAIDFRRGSALQANVLALQSAIESGKFVVTLRGAESQVGRWKDVLASGDPSEVFDFPNLRMIDKNLPLRFAKA